MLQIGRFHIVKRCQFPPSLIHRLNTIPTKIPVRFFIDINKPILNFTWKDEGIVKIKTILRKKNKRERIILPDFKNYNITT